MNVGLDDYENLSTGKMHNLCRGGAYIEMTSGKGAPIGRELIVTILNKRKADFLILRGKVAWRNGNGIGVEFIRA
jgi:Tfp pilus assembly protein PilZ